MANEDIISEKFIQYVAAAGDKAFENMSVEDLKTTIISILKSDIELAEKTPFTNDFQIMIKLLVSLSDVIISLEMYKDE
jgi:hypothetical protein